MLTAVHILIEFGLMLLIGGGLIIIVVGITDLGVGFRTMRAARLMLDREHVQRAYEAGGWDTVPCRSGHTDCTVDCGWCKGTGQMRAPELDPATMQALDLMLYELARDPDAFEDGQR